MQRCNVEAYEGNRPYLFVSYSHKDKDRVFPILEQMQQAGFRLWYDQGIESTSKWAEVIAAHLKKADIVLFCISQNFSASRHCKNELFFAQNGQAKLISLVLENDLQLEPALQLVLVRQQQIFLENYRDIAELVNSLKKEKDLLACLGTDSTAKNAVHKSMQLKTNVILRELQNETLHAAKQAYANCDFKQAMELYRTAYFGSNSTAGTLLAEMYYTGCYCPQDYDRAAQIFIDCMHRNNPIAAQWMSYCYFYGHGVPKDEEKSRNIFAECQDALEEMAILGSEDAQYELGYNLLYVKFTAPNPERGIYWLQKASESGFNVATFHLAKARLTGNGCPKDRDTAIRELNHCKNDPHCAYLLAHLLQKGTEGIKQNDSTAFEFLLAASQKGHTQAQSDLGDCYYEGKGTHVDYAQAIFWYQKAAEKGDLYSINQLGMQYLLAKGVPQDIDKAISFFEQSDRKGSAYGARVLGHIYCGIGKDGQLYKDLPKAVRFLQKGADRGVLPAAQELLKCYHGDFGKEVQDLPQYYKILQKAADLGDMASAYRLGRALVEGSGEPILSKDPDKGNGLIEQAAKANYADALLYMAEMSAYSAPQQSEQALFYIQQANRTLLAKGMNGDDLPFDILCRYGHIYLSLACPHLKEGSFNITRPKELTKLQHNHLSHAHHFFSLALHKDNSSHDALYWTTFLQLTYGFKEDTWNNAYLLNCLKEDEDPASIYLVGCLYRYGFGVAKDRAKAKEFLRKAAAHGSKEAADDLKTFWF